jgi:membrane protease YdiL (CAAX protease family)
MLTRPSPGPQIAPNANHTGSALLVGYLCLYAASLLLMNRAWQFEVAEPLLILGILGVGFSLVAWLLTIGVSPLDCRVAEPARELTALALYMLPLTAYITLGSSVIRRYAPADPANAVSVLVAKLVFFVIIPAWLMRALFGYRLRDLAPLWFRRRDIFTLLGMAVLLLGFQAVLGRGLHDIMQAHLPVSTLVIGFPIAFLWLALEAGVVEEFFFRVLLQSRLSAALGSELGGIVLMSVIFGLAHAPGLYLRTGMTQEGLPAHPPLLMAVGYSIVITSVAGFFLGVLWARTRNFLLVVLVHAVADLLPDLLPTLHSLRLVR